MSTLLLGDETEYPNEEGGGAAEVFSASEQAYQYTATATGTLTSIEAWVRGHPTDDPGTQSDYTTLDLAIYADDSGAPGALLGYGTVGPPAWAKTTSGWASATGLSVPITAGTDYWLALNPHGGVGVAYNRITGSGSTPAWDSEGDAFTAPADPFPASGPDYHFTGLIGLRGIGDTEDPTLGLLPRPAEPGYFRIEITSLHHGATTEPTVQDAVPARVLARLEDFTEASVTIPINDQREATVTINMNDPAAEVLNERGPYETLLRVIYATPTSAHLVFWGIITQPSWDSSAETLTIPAVDMSLRLQYRQVRWGTRILNASDDPDDPNPFNSTASKRSTGYIPLDYVGLGWIRDAARNNTPGDALGVPPLGITDGINTASPLPLDTPYKIEARRGDTLWDVWQQVVGYQIAPDFELEPREGTLGVYARLNTFARQGHADPSRIVFHDGFGRDNCLVTYEPGGRIVTHVHTLSTGDQARVTVSDWDSAAIYGDYVEWQPTDYPATDLTALHDMGQQTLNAYSEPPDYFQITPNLDAGLYYLDDYAVGDALTAAVRRGQLKRQVTGDIRSVKLTQVDDSGNVQPELEVAVTVSRTTTDGDDV